MQNSTLSHYKQLSFVKTLQRRHNGFGGVSNHQPHDFLLSRLFGRRSKKTSKLRVRWPVNSPHKWPLTGKMFPFDDIIMIIIQNCHFTQHREQEHHPNCRLSWGDLSINWIYNHTLFFQPKGHSTHLNRCTYDLTNSQYRKHGIITVHSVTFRDDVINIIGEFCIKSHIGSTHGSIAMNNSKRMIHCFFIVLLHAVDKTCEYGPANMDCFPPITYMRVIRMKYRVSPKNAHEFVGLILL